jgi:hypothetical protein
VTVNGFHTGLCSTQLSWTRIRGPSPLAEVPHTRGRAGKSHIIPHMDKICLF